MLAEGYSDRIIEFRGDLFGRDSSCCYEAEMEIPQIVNEVGAGRMNIWSIALQ